MQSYEKYPRLFSLPYEISLKKSPQRRDYQRVALENMLAFNASVCLCAFHQHISKLEEEDKEVPSNFQLEFELDQMSIGKWNQIARDTSKFLEDNNVKVNGVYQGSLPLPLYSNRNRGVCLMYEFNQRI